MESRILNNPCREKVTHCKRKRATSILQSFNPLINVENRKKFFLTGLIIVFCGLSAQLTAQNTACSTSKPLSNKYIACEGATVTIGFTLNSVYKAAHYLWWYNSSGVLIYKGNVLQKYHSITVVKDSSPVQTYYVEFRFEGSEGGSDINCALNVDIELGNLAGTLIADKSICYNTSPGALSATNPSGGTDMTYKWQQSSDGTSWTDVGVTTVNYSPDAIIATTYYRRVVTSGSCGTVYSNTVKITVNALPTPSITNAGAVCVNATLALTGSPTGGTWKSSNTAVATVSSSGVVTGVKAGSATITYTATNSDGCKADATASVTVKPIPRLSSSTKRDTICSGALFHYEATSATSGGTTFSWSRSAVAGISPSTGSDNSGVIDETLINATTDPIIVTYQIKLMADGCEYIESLEVVTLGAIKAGKIGASDTICSGQTPPALTSEEAASGGKGDYIYSWQYSTDNGNNWHYIIDANTIDYNPTDNLKQTTQYRRMVTDGCGTDFTTPVIVTVRSASLYNYPDLRIRACPDVGTTINLSKYIDTLDVTGIQWSSPVSSDGSIAASYIASSGVRTLTYTVNNPCLAAPVTRKIYLERLKPGRMRPLRDTIVICSETAEAVQINQIFGIEAGKGTWSYFSQTPGDVNAYVNKSTSSTYNGAVIMNGKAIYESSIAYYPYRDMPDAKKVEFTYTPANGSCLQGKTYKIVIILLAN